VIERGRQATDEMATYFRHLIEARRRQPGSVTGGTDGHLPCMG
jgi:cytochrome P450